MFNFIRVAEFSFSYVHLVSLVMNLVSVRARFVRLILLLTQHQQPS